MGKTLVIVESPTKAKTISKFLGKDYIVESSFGHIRDLPKTKLGIDIENDFTPKYLIPKDSKKRVAELKELVKKVDTVILATDEDREGEAIAWHLVKALDLDNKKIQRIVFHEITPEAIEDAIQNPRELNMNMVDSQQARRMLDRLVGYSLSPFLWKKVARGLSAGRVQSVAVKLIVEKEREIQAFKEEEYWTIEADVQKEKSDSFLAKLNAIDGKKLDKLGIKNEKESSKILKDLEKADFIVSKVIKKERSKKPPTPFKTSTLQQAGSNRFGFSSRQTMVLAQQLYEGIKLGSKETVGLITYMRTDSLNLASSAVKSIRSFVEKEYGKQYIPGKAVVYKTKAKGAQEAHEAIRPTDVTKTPEIVKPYLDARQYKVYTLIWQRTVASQMNPAITDSVTVDIEAKNYGLRSTGSSIKFDGFLKVYPTKTEEVILPNLKEKDLLDVKKIEPLQHFTQPPARYSEATLIKVLEERGIGRPSTYAPTIGTIIARRYVEKNDQKKLQPTDAAFIVSDLLSDHFSAIVDYEFTANMESQLDEIAEGKLKVAPMLKMFYLPFNELLEKKTEELTKADITSERVLGKDPKSGMDVVAKFGRFGPYVQIGYMEDFDDKEEKPKSASLKSGQSLESITLEDALDLLQFPKTLGKGDDGEDVIVLVGRFGPYLKSGTQTVSILNVYEPETITLEEAKNAFKNAEEIKKQQAKPLAELGKDPNTGKEVLIKTGRFGPYVTDGEINVSLGVKIDPKEITLEKAVEKLERKRNKLAGKPTEKK